MGKIIVSEFVSLDGVMEDPSWTEPYWNADIAKFKFDELMASDALLLGRITYEAFATAWPTKEHSETMKDAFSTRPKPTAFSEKMNSILKMVASESLKKLDWTNSRLIGANFVQKVKMLKEKSKQTMLVVGSGSIVQLLLQHDLVDELHLLVYPIVLGKGKKLLEKCEETTLRLEKSKTLGEDVVHLFYKRKESK